MKELWQLIKMLFSSKPGDFDTLSACHEALSFKGYRFMVVRTDDIPCREQGEHR